MRRSCSNSTQTHTALRRRYDWTCDSGQQAGDHGRRAAPHARPPAPREGRDLNELRSLAQRGRALLALVGRNESVAADAPTSMSMPKMPPRLPSASVLSRARDAFDAAPPIDEARRRTWSRRRACTWSPSPDTSTTARSPSGSGRSPCAFGDDLHDAVRELALKQLDQRRHLFGGSGARIDPCATLRGRERRCRRRSESQARRGDPNHRGRRGHDRMGRRGPSRAQTPSWHGVAGVLNAAMMTIHAIGQAYAAVAHIEARSGVKQLDRLLSNVGVALEKLFPELAWDGVDPDLCRGARARPQAAREAHRAGRERGLRSQRRSRRRGARAR